jgi:hypothetical protein
MQRYLLKDHWAQLVNEFKDSERTAYDLDGYATEQLSLDILDHLRITRFRQWTLFVQKRGEEFELFMAKLEKRGYDADAIKRFLDTEELWKTTIELATQ